MPLGLILLVHVALDHLFVLLYGFLCVYQKESIVLLVDIVHIWLYFIHLSFIKEIFIKHQKYEENEFAVLMKLMF